MMQAASEGSFEAMENGISKRQSAILQGAAIWMMVYHHMFLGVTAYGTVFPFLRLEVVLRIAWFCKICVGIFAFVSGYGLYYGMEKLPRERFFGRLRAEYSYVFRRILRLYGKLWFVLLLYLGYAAGIRRQAIMPGELWENITACNPTYNGAWWYVEQYAKMLLLLPLLDLFLTRFGGTAEKKKKGVFYALTAVFVLALMFLGGLQTGEAWAWPAAVIEWFRPAFLAVFAVGYLAARCRVYERWAILQKKWFGNREKPAVLCLSAVLIGIVIAVRAALAPDPAYAKPDFALTPFFVYGVLMILSYVKPLEVFFAWWGRYSAYIWLVHGFFVIPAFLLVRSFTALDLPAYLVTLGFSALAAIALTGMESLGIYILHRGKRENS